MKKFRARVKLTGEVYNVNTILFGGPHSFDVIKVDMPYYRDDNEFSSDDVDLLQYTGFKDKNGTEIYEGDTLEYTRDENDPTSVRLIQVAWSATDGAYDFGGIRTDYAVRNSIVVKKENNI